MIINDNFYYYDRPIIKNPLIGTGLVLTVLGFVSYLFDKNTLTLVVLCFFLFQLLISFILVFVRDRFCKFSNYYLEFRSNFFKPVVHINTHSIKELEFHDNKFIFHLINHETHTLSFPAKQKDYFLTNINILVTRNHINTTYKYYFTSSKNSIMNIINNLSPMLILIIGAILTGRKSLDDIGNIIFASALLLVGVVSIILFVQRKFIHIKTHKILIKKKYFSKTVKLLSTRIKSIHETESGFEIVELPNRNYNIKIDKKLQVEIAERLKLFCEMNKVSCQFNNE